MSEGGENCVKYLKRGWNRKEGKRNKDFKRGGRGSWRGALNVGDWNPLMNYVYQFKVSSDFVISNLGSLTVISMKLFRVVTLFFKVLFIMFIIGNSHLHPYQIFDRDKFSIFKVSDTHN